MERNGYGSMCKRCFRMPPRCWITTTVSNTSTGWPKHNMAPRYRHSNGSKRPSRGCTWGRSDRSSPGCIACSQRQTRLPRRLPIVGIISTSIGDGPITGSCVAGGIRWAVAASNPPTSSFVTCGSSARGPGGTRATATRCWPCAVRSTTVHWGRCLCGINNGNVAHKNHLMLLVHEGIPMPGGIASKHAHLTILHFAQRPTILPRHPHRVLAFFDKARLVEHQDPVGVAHLLGHELMIVPPHLGLIPDDITDKALQSPDRAALHLEGHGLDRLTF